ncbi:MAG: hypothetical protein WBK94_07600, partial [Tenuifilaceae bacterium]
GKLCPRDELAVRRHGGLYGDGCRRFDYRVSDAGFGTVQFFRQGNDGRLLGRAKPQALWFQSTPVHLQKYQPEPLLRRRVLIDKNFLFVSWSIFIDKNFLFVSWSIFSRLLYVKKIWTTRYRRWMI